MKAVILNEYGGPEVLKTHEIGKPVPKDNEILIKIHATSVNYGDIAARNFKKISPREFNMPFLFWIMAKLLFGLGKPKVKILGSEFSGIIDSVGRDVKTFKTGDQVFGYLGQKMGAYAEYLSMPEKGTVAIKPENMSFEEAAVVPYGSIMALNLLSKVNILPGTRVLINGASGSIGSAAVQIAKHLGAEVTGVCGTRRLEFVKSLGADEVIDYTKDEFTRNGKTYDIIFDILGRSSFSSCKNSLSEKGRYLRASFKSRELFQMLRTSVVGGTKGKRVICALAPGSKEDLNSVKDLMEKGKIKSIIDKKFPFEQTAEAHKYVEEGFKKGNVVITLAEK